MCLERFGAEEDRLLVNGTRMSVGKELAAVKLLCDGLAIGSIGFWKKCQGDRRSDNPAAGAIGEEGMKVSLKKPFEAGVATVADR